MKSKIDAIDAALPQTQCQLCEYQGCRPYAEAIINNNEHINKCLPGGVKVLRKLGELTNINPNPYLTEMRAKAKPPMRAIIREAECIGCTKCIQACPVDAVIGAAKYMHTIISDACNGCELCIPPCPVDCIDLAIEPERSDKAQQQFALQNRQRYYSREARLSSNKQRNRQQYEGNKLGQAKASLTARQASISAC
ncbi:MAG: RnfABCDGE type electron transport complex subunit B, partial [Gammaproteobacteria bacterium]|nr:RnfABCDGE type electron transport complex subunit B [Gammaproteobacteria bacterium]